jgi:hypothetical protein
MEVAAMKTFPARLLALAALVLALACIFACSDDDCVTCPTPTVCHDPANAFLGSWIVFESTVNGTPDHSMYVGMQWDFINHDTVVVATNTDPYVWSVNDSLFFMMSTPDPSDEFYAFSYEFEADTLNLTGVTGLPFSVYWRFRRMP